MTTAIAKKKKMSFGKRLLKEYPFHLMLLPGFIFVFVFKYIPMAGLCIAFQDYSPVYGLFDQYWIGLDNFRYVFSMSTFPRVIYNTVFIALLKIIAGIIVPVSFALLLNEIRHTAYKRTLQTVVYLPHFIATVVLVSMMNVLFSPAMGPFGAICRMIGIGNPPELMAMNSAFRPMFIGASIWQNAGWDSIIYIAALTSIDPSLYEAATVDGATKLQRVWHIDLPSILPTMVTLLIMRAGSIMNLNFDRAFLLQNDLNIGVSEIISTYEYKLGLKQGQFSYSAAIGLFNNIINLILLLIVNKTSKKLSGTGLW